MIIALLFLLLSIQPMLLVADEDAHSSWSIDKNEEHIFHSKIAEQDIRLFIRLPKGYQEKDESYAVLYYLDGYFYKDLIPGLVRAFEIGGDIPKLVLVGIDSDVDSHITRRTKRAMNLTPTSANTYESYGISATGTGGGEKFLRALILEIIPFIDSNYRTNGDDRSLVGHSFGGLFALHTLFSRHGHMFDRYLVSSPSIPWDGRIILKAEKQYAASHLDLPVRLYMSVGSLENAPDDMMVQDLQELTTILKLRSYPSLILTSDIIGNESHSSVIPLALVRGLRNLYSVK